MTVDHVDGSLYLNGMNHTEQNTPVATGTATSANIAEDMFDHVVEFRLVVCKQCQHAVWPTEIEGHLRGKEHKIKGKEAVAVAEYIRGWPGLIQYPTELQIPDHVNRPIENVRLYQDGLLCLLDPDRCRYICRNMKVIKKHWRIAHEWSITGVRGGSGKSKETKVEKRIEESIKKVHCQQFFPNRHGSQYFEVRMDDEGGPDCEPVAGSSSELAWKQFRSEAVAAWKTIERNTYSTIQSGTADEISPWLERAQWHDYLADLNREELMESVREPEADREPVEAALWSAMGELARFCQQSVKNRVGIFVRMEAIRTEKHQTRYHPLQPYRIDRDLEQHSRPWQQVMMFFARTQEPHEWKSPVYRLNRRQRDTWQALAAEARITATTTSATGDSSSRRTRDGGSKDGSSESCSDEDSGDEYSDGEDEAPQLTAIQRACLEFCMALLDQRVRRREYDSALVCALAVLGVGEGGWKGPHVYPPILSAMIKIARFMVVQQALEDYVSESDTSQEDDEEEERSRRGCIQMVGRMMDRFMIRGSQGPMQWMLDLRTYGMKIHYQTTSMGNVDWNGNQILYKSIQFTMPEFRGMVHGLVAETKRILIEDLLLCKTIGGVPAIPWRSLRDNPVDKTLGWSFLGDQRTPWPVEGVNWLFNWVGEEHERTCRFVNSTGANRQGISAYMSQVVEFREKMLVLMHITGGSPGRSPEILSIRHSNTAKGEHRNVFIEDGMVVFVTRYHKGYTTSGDVKVIHRYLPREVGELLVWYLWLVLPFQRGVEAMVWTQKTLSAHLWPADPDGKKWTSERMRKVIRRESMTGLGQALTIQAYRDVAIAISRKYLRGNMAFRMDEDDEDGDCDEDDWGAVAAEQAAHTLHVEGMIYARGILEQNGVVESKRQRFRGSSIRWHQFLGFVSSFGQTVVGRAGKRIAAPFEAEAEEARIQRWQALRTADMETQLRQLYGEKAAFRGVQEAAIKGIARGESLVLAVMPTGAGKSLLFMLPAMMGQGGTTIVVVPLITLREDMRRRCKELGIRCVEWDSRRPPDAATIVLVTPESAVTEGFMTFINRLKATRQLDRIVVDECHVVLNDRVDFRKQLQQMGKLMAAEVQMILLTATLPPMEEETLFERMMVTRKEVSMFRGPTTRKNIKYQVIEVGGRMEGLDEFVVRLVQQKMEKMVDGKVVVYCNTVKKVESLAGKLGCRAYYHMAEGKREMLSQFTEGDGRVIVATSALGMGVDIKGIRVVVHADEPRSLLDYGQESGRAGRDGSMSEAIVVVGAKGRVFQGRDEDRELVRKYLMVGKGVAVCRRVVLDRYLDGRMTRVGCEEGEEKCDVCGEVEDKNEKQEREEYRRQQQQLKRPWEGEKAKVQDFGVELETLERGLREWTGVCGVCKAAGREYRHELRDCQQDDSKRARTVGLEFSGGIKFDRFAGCWWCGVPQAICNRWEQKEQGYYQRREGGSCQYGGVMAWALAGMTEGSRKGGIVKDRWMRRLEESGLHEEDVDGLRRHLGKKIKIGDVESNGMAREFCWIYWTWRSLTE